jgi:hypothetical protein
MRLHPPIQIITLSETPNEHNSTHQPALRPNRIHLALYQINNLLHHRIKDLFHLLRTHHQEAAIQPRLFIIW